MLGNPKIALREWAGAALGGLGKTGFHASTLVSCLYWGQLLAPKVVGITSQRLLDQSQAGVYMGKTPHTPPFWPFWAYSRTLPQVVELLVEPLVKSLFCPINASPNEILVRTPPPPRPPPLETHFFQVLREGGGWGGGGGGVKK